MKKSLTLALPVFNGQDALLPCVCKTISALDRAGYRYDILVVNNGSTDRSLAVATACARRFQNVSFIDLPWKGRGLALKTAWQTSTSDIQAYMDVDLSTNLAFLPDLLNRVGTEAYDIAIGSRLLNESVIKGSIGERENRRGLRDSDYSYTKTNGRRVWAGGRWMQRQVV